ncbi:putative uncharacterized protein DDB_G0282133 isoform X1 [Stomoxys calcitrans]|uniref:putative uncharacterized protein DDB_G0282133 isoform X1 n=1 Tax=Stomoxys calcitrans TaxID=35570 RepID=UPI0027E25F18|nr:putative uncharacterized protein DDB_G0282133 isoform X1 [Stomoxys calcitrans]
MWNQWSQYAGVVQSQPPLPMTAAPPPPPSEPSQTAAPPPPGPTANAPLIGPVTAAAAAAVSSVPTVAAAAAVPNAASNPYSQYTAAQYAALTPEQQYTLQQHWQQWQKYQEEYAKWHAQYGEQYKREMEAAVAPAPTSVPAQSTVPTAANYPAFVGPMPPTTAVQPPVDSKAAAPATKITGQPQLYSQPPPQIGPVNQYSSVSSAAPLPQQQPPPPPPSSAQPSYQQQTQSQQSVPWQGNQSFFNQPPPNFSSRNVPNNFQNANSPNMNKPNQWQSGPPPFGNLPPTNEPFKANMSGGGGFNDTLNNPRQNLDNNDSNEWNRGPSNNRGGFGNDNMNRGGGRSGPNNENEQYGGRSGPPDGPPNRGNFSDWQKGGNSRGGDDDWNIENRGRGGKDVSDEWNNRNRSRSNDRDNWRGGQPMRGDDDGPWSGRPRDNGPNNNREWNDKPNDLPNDWRDGPNNRNQNFNNRNNFNSREFGNNDIDDGRARDMGRNRDRDGDFESDNRNSNNRYSGGWNDGPNDGGRMNRSNDWNDSRGNNRSNNWGDNNRGQNNWSDRSGNNNWNGGRPNFGPNNNNQQFGPQGGSNSRGGAVPDIDEEKFDRQFKQWEEQFEDWKRANANHPDREMYKRYEQEFEKQRTRIMERREQMRRRKMERMGLDPNQPPPTTTANSKDNMPSGRDGNESDKSRDSSRNRDLPRKNSRDLSKNRDLQSKGRTDAFAESGSTVAEDTKSQACEDVKKDDAHIDKPKDSEDLQEEMEASKKNKTNAPVSIKFNVQKSTPLGKRKSRFDTAGGPTPNKVKTPPGKSEGSGENPTEIINLDDDDDDVVDTSPVINPPSENITEIFKKSDGIPGLDLVEDGAAAIGGKEDKVKPESEGTSNKSKEQGKIPSLFDIKINKPDMKVSPAIPDISKTLNDPEFMKKISEALAKAQGKGDSQQLQQQYQIDDMKDAGGRPLSYAEWQRKKQLQLDHPDSNFDNENSNQSNDNMASDRMSIAKSQIEDEISNASYDRSSRFNDDGEDRNMGDNSFGPNNRGGPNEWGPGGPNGNWGPNDGPWPNNNFNNRGGPNWGPNGPNNNWGPNNAGGGNNWGPDGGRNIWGPNGGGNGPNNWGNNNGPNGPNGPNNWGPNNRGGPNNWGPNNRGGPNNWGPNGPNSGGGGGGPWGNNNGPWANNGGGGGGPNNNGPFGNNNNGPWGNNNNRSWGNNGGGGGGPSNWGPNNNNNNFGPNFRGGPNNRNFGPNGPNGPNNFGPNGPNNFSFGPNSNFGPNGPNLGPNGPNNSNFGPNGPKGESKFGPNNRNFGPNTNEPGRNFGCDGPQNQQDSDNSNSAQAPRNTNNPFRRNESIKAPSLDGGSSCGGNSPRPRMKGPGDNLDYGDYFRPVQVIDYTNNASGATKVIDYGHRPVAEEFKPVKVFNYDHAPKPIERMNQMQQGEQNKKKTRRGGKNRKNWKQQERQQQQDRQTESSSQAQLAIGSNENNEQKEDQHPNDADNTQVGDNREELEDISDTDDLPDQMEESKNEDNPAAPPPPMYSSRRGDRAFKQSEQHHSSSTSSIFPSTAEANENITKMTVDHVQMSIPTVENNNTIAIEEILLPPGRETRPKKICIILRGPPGSGKSYVAKLIKEKEKEMSGNNPRVLSIDDYFLIENDYEEKCPKTGKKIPKKEILYEYDKDMEETYMQYLIKSFKKTILDNFYDFIVIDCNNNSLRTLNEFYCHAKDSGYVPYIIDLLCDLDVCLENNVHERTEADIKEVIDNWKPTPFHYIKLDVANLVQNVVEMEDVEDMPVDENTVSENAETLSQTADETDKETATTSAAATAAVDGENVKDTQEADDDQEEAEDDSNDSTENKCGFLKSKWETDTTTENLARLDGTSKLNTKRKQTMEEYLQMDDWQPIQSNSKGKKRVRWADIEEKRQQEKMRAVGFVVGQTDWKRMMDPYAAKRALNKMKYIERVNKQRR